MKKEIIFLITLLLLLTTNKALAMKQVFVNGSPNDLNSATVEYNGVSFSGFGAGLSWNATENNRTSVMPANGTLRNLIVELTGSPGAGNSYAFVLMVNNSPSALTTTISDAETSDSDQANDVSVSAGDVVSIRVTPSSTPTVRDAKWSLEFEGDTANESVLMGIASPFTSSITYFHPNVRGEASNTEAGQRLLVPLDGTIKALYINLSATPGTGNQYTYAIFKNGSQEASSVVTLSDAETADNVTGLNIDIAPGDSFSIEVIPTSIPTANTTKVGVVISADTDGESIIGGTTNNDLNISTTEYNHFTGSDSVAWTATEANTVSSAGVTGFTLKNFRVELIGGSPGSGGDAYQFAIRKDSGAGNSTCTITNAETTCTDGVNTDDFVSGNDLSIENNPAVTPTARDARWSAIQNIAAAPAARRSWHTTP